MGVLARIICLALICAIAGAEPTPAQQAGTGCQSEPGPKTAQTLRCGDRLIIVAEDGAKFTLQARNRDVTSVNLQSKAVLIEEARQPGKSHFRVITPQAIAAVRGTKWAVDVQETRTSVLVLNGEVTVRKPNGPRRVVLGPGEGVDVDQGSDSLAVKRWAQARVDALLARLGQ